MTINIDTHNNERNLFHFAREKLKKMLYTVLCAFGVSITFLSEERRIYNEYRRKMVQIFGEYGDDDEDGDFMNYHLPLHKLSWIALTHNSSTSTSTSFSSWIIVEEYIKCLQHLNAVNRAIVSKDGELGNTPLHLAVHGNNYSVAKLMLRIAPEAALIRDVHGNLPLHWAAAHNENDDNSEMIHLLTSSAPLSFVQANDNGVFAPLCRRSCSVKRDAMLRGIMRNACGDRYQDYGKRLTSKLDADLATKKERYYHPLVNLFMETCFGARTFHDLEHCMKRILNCPDVVETLSMKEFRHESLLHIMEIRNLAKEKHFNSETSITRSLLLLKLCYLLSGDVGAYKSCDQVYSYIFDAMECNFVHEQIFNRLHDLLVVVG